MRTDLKEIVNQLKQMNNSKAPEIVIGADEVIDLEAVKKCPYSGQIISAIEKNKIDKEIKIEEIQK